MATASLTIRLRRPLGLQVRGFQTTSNLSKILLDGRRRTIHFLTEVCILREGSSDNAERFPLRETPACVCRLIDCFSV
jgi:hypothetical protein